MRRTPLDDYFRRWSEDSPPLTALGGDYMNMKKYMTFEATWKPLIQIDEDTHRPEYGEEQTIKCFIYGKDIFVRQDTAGSVVTAKVYLTLANVKPDDMIDGQVVKSVNSYPESWDSKVQLYEVLTWES